MGKDLGENFPAAKQVFEEADDALGFALSELCYNGPADQLQLTENTQPAILTTSAAALRAMQADGFSPPAFVAGHSLGEYSALVAANGLKLLDAVKTVRARGRYMQEAVPVGTGAMAAILGALPLALGFGDGAELCQPLGISIIGGLIVSQILTLYTTPVIYLYLDRFAHWLAGLRRRPAGEIPPSVPAASESPSHSGTRAAD